MPTKLLSLKHSKRVTYFLLSKDWYSTIPWQHKGVDQPYFSQKTETIGEVDLVYFYVGPFALVSGKLTVL